MPEIIELSVFPSYVDWNIWECLREIVQNAVDAQTDGYPMKIEHLKNTKTFVVSNEKARLDRSSLVLGVPGKKGRQEMRGNFGEGYKLACMSLANNGIAVEIHNGYEIWKPSIVYSTKFQAKVLAIAVERNNNIVFDGVRYKIGPITEQDFDALKFKMLFLSTPAGQIKTTHGTLITDRSRKNNIYCKGIFAHQSSDAYVFAYDLNNLQLDRDRKLSEAREVRLAVSEILTDAIENRSIDIASLYDILNSKNDCGEQRAIDEYPISEKASGILYAHFQSLHGELAVPVETLAEVIKAKHVGRMGVICSRHLVHILNSSSMFDLCAAKVHKDMEVKRHYNLTDLTITEQENVFWATNVIRMALGDLNYQLNIVEFHGDSKVLGTFEKRLILKDVINISRNIVRYKIDFISTLIHEIAHKWGNDGTVEHIKAIQNLNARIIVGATDDDSIF